MRLIAIEEHFEASAASPSPDNGFNALGSANPNSGLTAKLQDLGRGRLSDMDAAGIDVQVLSQTAGMTTDYCRDISRAAAVNDELAAAIAQQPDRFAGFATLAFGDPEGSAAELERAVTSLGFKGALVSGIQGGRFLDDAFFWPIFECAEALKVPIYLHPAEPPAAVRGAYYSGLDPVAAQMLATSAWGWHVENGLHALRLIVGGVFDQFPGLQFIIGHMGEAVPFYLARAEQHLKAIPLRQPLTDCFVEHFYVTTSGMFTYPPLLCLLLVVGADRVIFSVDYPYSAAKEGRAFIDAAPMSPADRDKIAHGNAERLLGM